jgi:hypothetical protein
MKVQSVVQQLCSNQFQLCSVHLGPPRGTIACTTGDTERAAVVHFQLCSQADVGSARTAPLGSFEGARGAYLARFPGEREEERREG